MIPEEFKYECVSEYLKRTNELSLVGFPGKEERSYYFANEWKKNNKDILFFKRIDENVLLVKAILNGNEKNIRLNINSDVDGFLRMCRLNEKNVLLDMSSLDHVLIMFLTKIMLTSVKPKTFLASYIRPQKYNYQEENVGFSLCEHVSAIKSVPGFVKRESQNEVLCAFIGFEGIRVKGMLELLNNIKRFVPIVAFPSGTPHWFNVTMWNCMDILQSGNYEYDTRKCYSESIYDAVDVLMKNVAEDERVVLAPLGTRPHSMACAIFACHHKHTRIIYDYVIENEQRATGIDQIQIYNITPYIKI